MEQRKVLLIIVSITVILAATIGIGLLLFYPREDVPQATADTEFWDPMDFLAGSGSRPGFESSVTDDSGASAEGTPEDRSPEDEDEDEDDGSFSVTYGVREVRPSQEPDARTPGARLGTPSVIIQEEEPEERPSAVSRVAERDPADSSALPRREATPPAASREGGSTARPSSAVSTRPKVTEEQALATRAYWVQVISSPNRDTVEQAQRSLATHQVSTRVLTKEIGGTVYYRLRLGPFAVREEAEKFLDWVLDLDRFADALIFVDYTTSVRAASGS